MKASDGGHVPGPVPSGDGPAGQTYTYSFTATVPEGVEAGDVATELADAMHRVDEHWAIGDLTLERAAGTAPAWPEAAGDISPALETARTVIDTTRLAKLLDTARDLTGPDMEDVHSEYLRGQMNLICDLAGLAGDEYSDLIYAVLTHRESTESAVTRMARQAAARVPENGSPPETAVGVPTQDSLAMASRPPEPSAAARAAAAGPIAAGEMSRPAMGLESAISLVVRVAAWQGYAAPYGLTAIPDEGCPGNIFIRLPGDPPGRFAVCCLAEPHGVTLNQNGRPVTFPALPRYLAAYAAHQDDSPDQLYAKTAVDDPAQAADEYSFPGRAWQQARDTARDQAWRHHHDWHIYPHGQSLVCTPWEPASAPHFTVVTSTLHWYSGPHSLPGGPGQRDFAALVSPAAPGAEAAVTDNTTFPNMPATVPVTGDRHRPVTSGTVSASHPTPRKGR